MSSKLQVLALLGVTNAVTLKREPLLAWSPTPPASHPTDYFVPNFGQDHLIKQTTASEIQASEQLGHKWIISDKKKPAPPPKDYFVPNFGQEQDIKDSIKHLDNAEKKYGQWTLPDEDVQLEASREPLLSWKPIIAAPSHPMDYFVPSFGVDHDIMTSNANQAATEESLGQWDLQKDEASGKFIVPDSNIDNLKINKDDRFPALDMYMQREPLLSWKPVIASPSHPMDYFVP